MCHFAVTCDRLLLGTSAVTETVPNICSRAALFLHPPDFLLITAASDGEDVCVGADCGCYHGLIVSREWVDVLFQIRADLGHSRGHELIAGE